MNWESLSRDQQRLLLEMFEPGIELETLLAPVCLGGVAFILMRFDRLEIHGQEAITKGGPALLTVTLVPMAAPDYQSGYRIDLTTYARRTLRSLRETTCG